MTRFVKKEFIQNYKATIGADFETTNVQVDDKVVCLQIWYFRFLVYC